MYKWQRYHIFDELEKHGCNITIYNPLNYLSVDIANDNLTNHLNKKNYDLFMTPLGSKDLYVDTLLRIKKNIPTLLICFDNLIVPFKHKDIAKHFDLVWLTSRDTCKMFKLWGANIIINPYAANPYYFKPNYISEIERIAFIGTPYGSRVNMINLLLENNIDVSLYSNSKSKSNKKSYKRSIKGNICTIYNLMGFNIGRRVLIGALKQKINRNKRIIKNSSNLKQMPPVGLEKLSKLYSNHALSLASTAARNTGVLKKPVNIVNLRSFEIPMSGGLQICSYCDELAEYFEEDKEIIFYRNNEELIDKARFYLKSENYKIRMKMKTAARRRAENDHTWFDRFKKVFDYFGIKYK